MHRHVVDNDKCIAKLINQFIAITMKKDYKLNVVWAIQYNEITDDKLNAVRAHQYYGWLLFYISLSLRKLELSFALTAIELKLSGLMWRTVGFVNLLSFIFEAWLIL